MRSKAQTYYDKTKAELNEKWDAVKQQTTATLTQLGIGSAKEAKVLDEFCLGTFERVLFGNASHGDKIIAHRPLLIGCSGGGGHNAAINAVNQVIEKEKTVKSPLYTPPARDKDQDKGMNLAVHIADQLGEISQKFLARTPIPVLPKEAEINEEVKKLENNQTRVYIDLLLDACPGGYVSAAIWNCLQRNDKTKELKKLIRLQRLSDKKNYEPVKKYILDVLNAAKESHNPYTTIISTQAMALPALCDAAIAYNETYHTHIKIHQYLTDLPTKGAVHFFDSFAGLNAKQRRCMILYGVGFNVEILEKALNLDPRFSSIIDISPENNPMVRAGFRDQARLKPYQQFDQKMTLYPKGINPVIINSHEKVASVMLGSQAGAATVDYILSFLETGQDKIFAFCGGNLQSIEKDLDAALEKAYPNETLRNQQKQKIFLLSNQSDKEMAPIMTRSNVKVIRGGGLSVMEEMAMPHNSQQAVLIHHKDPAESKEADTPLSSGISWEDGNVDQLISYLSNKGIYAEKTCPAKVTLHIKDAQHKAATPASPTDAPISVKLKSS